MWILRNLLLVDGMLVIWILASGFLAAASVLLRLSDPDGSASALTDGSVGPRSWEGFAVLNAFGTCLVAGSTLALIDGRWSPFLVLDVGMVLKVVLVPLNGAIAYALLARRVARAEWRIPAPGPSGVARPSDALGTPVEPRE